MKRGKKEEENALKLNKKCILLTQKSFKKRSKKQCIIVSSNFFFCEKWFHGFSSTEEDVAN